MVLGNRGEIEDRNLVTCSMYGTMYSAVDNVDQKMIGKTL